MLVEPVRQAAPGWTPPPACPQHPGGHVVRDGTYGTRTVKRRQRYRCTPPDGGKPHAFTPPLAREHVHPGREQCDECDELRGVHHGEPSVARRHSWPVRLVARGLAELAGGKSYGDTSRWALRQVGREPRRTPAAASEPPADDDDAAGGRKPKNPGSAAANNCWHVAADWVEAFAPAIYAPVEQRLREQALTERARLDALVEAGEAVDRPQVWLLDDVPVYGRAFGQQRARRDEGFFILVAAEADWSTAGPTDVPFAVDGPEPRLRLVRAMAKSNHLAWRLLFDEMGYHPDFVVADAGTGIRKAVEAHFDPARTRFVPSLWHLQRTVVAALADTRGAFVKAGDGKRLRGELAEHLARLGRESPALADRAGWQGWRDELEQLCADLGLPRDKVHTRRERYEQPFAEALEALAAQPQVPLTTGGLETLIAKRIDPLLERRRAGFGNIERTNHLLDLVAALEHGAFDNLADVARRLREDAATYDGWTVPLRAVADARPPGGYYSSLRDATLLAELAKQRGIT